MAAPRNENIKIRILDSTKELLEKNSFSDISLAEIANKSGISKGTLYYHYKNKNEIFFDLTDMYLSEQWNDFIKWTDNKEKDTSVPRLIKYVIERATAESKLRIQLISAAQIGDEATRQKLINRYDEFHRLISNKIAERTNIPAEFLTWLILLVSDGIIVQESIGNEAFDEQKFINQCSQYLIQFTEKNNKTDLSE